MAGYVASIQCILSADYAMAWMGAGLVSEWRRKRIDRKSSRNAKATRTRAQFGIGCQVGAAGLWLGWLPPPGS